MSLLPTDQLDILIQRDVVQWRRSKWRKRAVDHGVLPYESSAERWSGALSAMHELIGPIKGSQNIKVVLSNHFVRYALLPWQRGLSTAEWTEYARHQFNSIYGKSAADWDFRVDFGAPECPRVASAIDTGLIRDLQALIHSKKMRLTSVQPLLMNAYNHCRPHLRARCFWFVVAEPGKASLGLISNGGWRRLQSRLTREDVGVELIYFLGQEALIYDEPEADAPVYIYAPHIEPPQVDSGEWRLHWLAAAPLKTQPADVHDRQATTS